MQTLLLAIDMGSGVFTGIITILIALVLFLLLRQVSLWYFRINEQLEKMADANEISRQQTLYMQNQELMMLILLQHQLGTETKIALTHKSSGKVAYVSVTEMLKNYVNVIDEYEVILLKSGS